MELRELLYEGKAQKVYRNNRISEVLVRQLEEHGVEDAYQEAARRICGAAA